MVEIKQNITNIMKGLKHMNKSLEIKTALRNQFKEGTSKMAKRVCYGYLQDENGNLIINEAEAEIVKWIFESYLSGYSLGRIANELYQKGIKSPTGRDKWNREAIDKLLSNEKYLGIVLLQKTFSIMGTQFENKGIRDKYLTRNSHSAIISIELFKKVQQAKVERGRGTKIGENTASDMLNVISML